jgi:hypothetical protein
MPDLNLFVRRSTLSIARGTCEGSHTTGARGSNSLSRKLLLLVLIALPAYAEQVVDPSTVLSLRNGKVFRGVKITRETDDAIFVRYNAGMVKIFKTDLSLEMQQRYPTPAQRAQLEAARAQKEMERTNADRSAADQEILERIKKDHSRLIARITKPAPAEREILGVNSSVSWNMAYDESGRNILFTSSKSPAGGGSPEILFEFELPAEDLRTMISLVRKFEDWCAICSQETPKPTVEKVLGMLGSSECLFRYSRKTGGSLWIGGAGLQEADASHFLALSTTEPGLSAENQELQAKNQAIAERLK